MQPALREKESELNEKLTEGKESYEKLKTGKLIFIKTSTIH